ncbi:helix-turn-helix domain-containing protein [Corynebacterium xerosis]|uniref:helix-turn-helix domain-containing protein n=1 Tax=Corynebacterium xerosis TaxID=1725 RepID=UPI003670DD8E
MSTPTRAVRKHTARELGERFGRSPRTIRRIIAQERSEFLAQARERGQRIVELRAKGMSMRAIADEIGCSVGTVHRYVKESRE